MNSLQVGGRCYSSVMPLPLDDTDFIDRDVQDARAAGRATQTEPAAVAPRPPTREELAAKVTETQHQIAELKRAHDELERERSALEEARRRRGEFETGRAEVIERITRGIGLLEKAEFETRKNAEAMARTLDGFKTALSQVQDIKEENWTLENWNTELTRALTTVENARMEWNAAQLKWPLLEGATAPLQVEQANQSASSTARDLLGEQSLGRLCKVGLALTWPLAVVALLAVAVFVLVLLWK